MSYKAGVPVADEEMSDDAVINQLEHGAEIREMEQTKGWKLLLDACGRVADQARRNLEEVRADDTVKIVEYQQIAKLYGRVLKSLVESMKQEGALAVEEVKRRGLIGRIKEKFQKT